MAELAAYGQQTQEDTNGEYNALAFVIGRLLAKVQTMTVVKVIKCTNAGELAPVGFVDVQPMVNQMTGNGQAVEHGVIYNVPYFRLQGGTDAVIIDPKAGDMGLCCFASKDISNVKAAKGQANPGSERTHDWADGVYIGGILNGTPSQFIRYSSAGIEVVSPTQVKITAPVVQVNATTSATITTASASVVASASASITAPAITLGASGQTLRKLVDDRLVAAFNAHTHPDPITGNTGAPNTTIGAGQTTSTVQGG
jgi:hypothetical protein